MHLLNIFTSILLIVISCVYISVFMIYLTNNDYLEG
jgi:hypothetical protein